EVRVMTLCQLSLRWPKSARKAKRHAIALAVFMWASALAIAFMGTSDRSIAGPLKGTDFIHFYALGHLAAAHQTSAMFDIRGLHQAQVGLVPESAESLYPTVYPPQVAVFFAPLSGWSYQRALLIWSVVSIALYALIVWSAWKAVADRLPDRTMV